MRWLICGGWHWDWYEAACACALRALGEEVFEFSWSPMLERGKIARIENKWVIAGPSTLRMNRALEAKAKFHSPDVVLIWRGVHVLPATLQAIRRANRPLLVSYNNDDPFGPLYSKGDLHLRRLWRIFKRTIPEYDLHFVYREATRRDFIEAGARNAKVLLPYFIPDLDRPIDLSPEDRQRFSCNVVFVGHFENDGRLQHLRALVQAGLNVKLFGTGWYPENLGSLSRYFGDVGPLRGDDYRKAVIAADFALCFLSRLNRDDYTRRCFEIPACGAILLSERTQALEQLFHDGREAVFFSTGRELVSRVESLLREPARLAAIRAAGLERVHRDGHSVNDRMQEMLSSVQRARLALNSQTYPAATHET